MDTFTFYDELLTSIHREVERGHWFIISVGGNQEMPSYAYTIGLIAGFNHPELIIVGLGARSAHACLTPVAEAVAAGSRFEAGDLFTELPEVALTFGPVAPEHWTTDLFAMWVEYHGSIGSFPQPDALQVIWADPSGHLPSNPLFDPALRKFVVSLAEGGC